MLPVAERPADRVADPGRPAGDPATASATCSGGSSPRAPPSWSARTRWPRPPASTARRPGGAGHPARTGGRRRTRRGSRRRRGAGRPCSPLDEAIASISRSTAFCGSPPSSAAKACTAPSSPSRSSRMRAARPSAAKSPCALASVSSAPSRSPALRCMIARRSRASARAGSSSMARRSDASSPASISASASEGSSASKNCATLGGGTRAEELGDDRAVLEGLDGRDRLDLELPRDPLVGVGVDLGEDDLALALGGGLLEDRAQRAARAAPLRPEVDDDGDRLGLLDDLLLEVLLGDVDHGHVS